jgi:hypothetical protein
MSRRSNTLAAVLLTSLVTGATLGQTLTVGSPTTKCGDTVNVSVSISSTSGLLAVQFDIAYDKNKVTATNVVLGSLTSTFSPASNLATPGIVKVALASGTPVSGSGTVASITFKAHASASDAVPLTISNILVNDVARSGNGGTITISCVQPPEAPTYSFPANGSTNVDAPVKLRWKASSGATGYRVYLGIGSPSFFDSTSATSLNVETATGTTYNWYVRAENNVGTSDRGETWTFTTSGPVCKTPAAPMLAAPGAVLSGTSYDVGWATVANATEYTIEEATNPSFTGAASTQTSSTKLSLTKSVSASATWYYRVRARNTASGCDVNGLFSDTAAVTVSPKPPIPPGANVLAAVGSTSGALGSMFRTSVQLHNQTVGQLRGRIVFHVAGTTGGDADPFLPYDLAPGETISFLDLLPAMGIASGLGSADLVPDPLASALPLVVTRIYNDGGFKGTAGMTLDAAGLHDALFAGQKGGVLAPMDPTMMRMNVGVRTLADGATFTITMRSKAGTIVASKQVSYPPTYFTQHSAEGLLGAPMSADASLTFAMESGSAIIYASTTDNTTQDTQIQIARPID